MTVVLIAAAVGAVITVLNEIIKQAGWPKPANAAIAIVVQGLGLLSVAVQHAGGLHGVNWSDIGRALLGAVVGYAGTYGPIVKGLLNDWLQHNVGNVVAARPPTSTAVTRAALVVGHGGDSRLVPLEGDGRVCVTSTSASPKARAAKKTTKATTTRRRR